MPAGFITDGASIPLFKPEVLDGSGQSERAAVVHDWLYKTGAFERKAADQLFERMLKAEGVPRCARRVYYAGVRAGGWVPYNHYRELRELARARGARLFTN